MNGVSDLADTSQAFLSHERITNGNHVTVVIPDRQVPSGSAEDCLIMDGSDTTCGLGKYEREQDGEKLFFAQNQVSNC